MNVVDLMLREHDTVNELFALYQKAGVSSTASKESVANRVAQAVCEHADHEQHGLYPCLADAARGSLEAGLVEGAQAHAVMHRLIDRVVAAVGDPSQLDAAMVALRAAVSQHFVAEETALFESLRALFSEQELRQMGRHVAAQAAIHGAPAPTLCVPRPARPSGLRPCVAVQADGTP